MKLVIAGSRTFKNYQTLHEGVRQFTKRLKENGITIDTIVSGGAKGADELGERLAKQYSSKISLIVMKADWDKYGKRAGYLRNEQMLEIADAVIVFIENESKGSTHMAEISAKKGIPTSIITIGGGVVYRNV